MADKIWITLKINNTLKVNKYKQLLNTNNYFKVIIK